MRETHHSDEPSQEPPLTPRERAQRRQVELYGEPEYVEPTKSPEELAAEMRVKEMRERQTQRLSDDMRWKLQLAFDTTAHGRRLYPDARPEVELALGRYRADLLTKPHTADKRIVHIAILERLLAGESLDASSFEILLTDIRKHPATATSSPMHLLAIYNMALNLFQERGWIGIAYPQNGAEGGEESLA